MPDPSSQHPDSSITARTIGHYLETLGSSDPTPGGGSAAGLIGALGASLGLMVISLTATDDTAARTHLDTARTRLETLRTRFADLARDDEAVYQDYRDAAAMPRESSEEKATRRETMQKALKHAASVPLAACEAAVELVRVLVPVQEYGNPYLLSDARIAFLCADTCFEASRINVNVNLAMIRDDDWVTNAANQVESLASQLREHLHSN